MASEFQTIFVHLRALLEKHRGTLVVSDNTSRRFCLTGGCHPTHKVPFPIAWVEINKAYVSYHHMGVYCASGLLAGTSDKLKQRMQGKSCFNFKTVDEPLFAELKQLTIQAFAALKTNLVALNSKSKATR